MIGTIKKLVFDKGYGFIRDDNSQEYFFHMSGCDTPFATLRLGQTVKFETEESDRGLRACSIVAQ